LLVVAPWGLITILVFYSVLKEEKILLVNSSLIIQVVLLTAFIMMISQVLKSKKLAIVKTNQS